MSFIVDSIKDLRIKKIKIISNLSPDCLATCDINNIAVSGWYTCDEGSVYLRFNNMIKGYPTITILNIKATNSGKGWLTRMLEQLKGNYKGYILFDNVYNTRLESFLKRIGYSKFTFVSEEDTELPPDKLLCANNYIKWCDYEE